MSRRSRMRRRDLLNLHDELRPGDIARFLHWYATERYPSPSGGVMVSTIEHPNAAWVHGLVMRRPGLESQYHTGSAGLCVLPDCRIYITATKETSNFCVCKRRITVVHVTKTMQK